MQTAAYSKIASKAAAAVANPVPDPATLAHIQHSAPTASAAYCSLLQLLLIRLFLALKGSGMRPEHQVPLELWFSLLELTSDLLLQLLNIPAYQTNTSCIRQS